MSKFFAREILKSQLRNLQEKGLKGISFYPVKVTGATAEDYYAELSRMIDAIERDEGKPLKFNDSQKKTMRFDNLRNSEGETIEIEISDDFQISELPGKRAKKFANQLRQVKDLDEVAELGKQAGKKLRKVFGK